MTSPVRAPRPTPRRQPIAEPVLRPDLRIVGAPTRRVRPGFWVAAASTIVFAALFIAAVAHSLLVSGQAHLDQVGQQTRIEEELLAQDQLRLARVQSPERITREATRLGMVPAAEQHWVSPGTGAEPIVTGGATEGSPDTSGDPEVDSSSSTDEAGTSSELAAGTTTSDGGADPAGAPSGADGEG